MVWLYLAALIFGGAFTIPMVLGGLGSGTDAELDFGDADFDADFDGGFDFDVDTDIDVGADIDAGDFGDADASGVLGGVGDFALSLLSFRSLVFYSTFFGVAGLVLSLFDYIEPVPLVTALVLGFVAASVNTTLMNFLRGSEADSAMPERGLIGRPAQVVLPLGPGERGRVKIDVNGQPRFFVARALRDSSDQIYSLGEPVLVCDFDNGTALVAPMPVEDL